MSLYKRNRVYWISKNINGMHYRVSTDCTNRDEAEIFLGNWLAQMLQKPSQTGMLNCQAEKESLTLEELLYKYFKDDSFSELAPQSQRRYRTSAKLFLEKFGPIPISKITPLMLDDFKKGRISQGIKPATSNRDFAFLKCLYNWAIEFDICIKNPVKKRLFQRLDNARKRRFSEEEEILILQEAKEQDLDWFFTITVLGIYTRGRRAEIVNLQRENINLKKKTITYTETKNGEPRIEPLCKKAHMTLGAWLKNKKLSPKDYVFPGITADRVTRVHIRIVGKLGIKDLCFHDTGRTFINRLREAHVETEDIQQLSGHKDRRVLLKHYLDSSIVSPLRKKVAKLDKNLSQFVTILESGKK